MEHDLEEKEKVYALVLRDVTPYIVQCKQVNKICFYPITTLDTEFKAVVYLPGTGGREAASPAGWAGAPRPRGCHMGPQGLRLPPPVPAGVAYSRCLHLGGRAEAAGGGRCPRKGRGRVPVLRVP